MQNVVRMARKNRMGLSSVSLYVLASDKSPAILRQREGIKKQGGALLPLPVCLLCLLLTLICSRTLFLLCCLDDGYKDRFQDLLL